MKTIILFLFSSGLVSAALNGTIHGQPRMEDCGKIRDNPYKFRFSQNKGLFSDGDFLGDDFCDDLNNNEGCVWDLGDCCNNDNDSWDLYCTACECLEPVDPTSPTTTYTTTPTRHSRKEDCGKSRDNLYKFRFLQNKG